MVILVLALLYFKTQEEVEKAFSETLCKKCRYELKKKQEVECNEYIKGSFEALELPELEGTEKQIAWANKIREEMVNMWGKNLIDEIISPVSELISIKSYGPAFSVRLLQKSRFSISPYIVTINN